MHVSTDKDPVEIKGRKVYYQLQEFSYKKISCMQKEFIA